MLYNEAGGLAEKRMSDGTRMVYSQDELGRITALQVISAMGKALTQVKYGWDSAGQLTSREWDLPTEAGKAKEGGVKQSYSYDLSGQLTGVTSSNPGKLPSEKYVYDLAGNMIEKSVGTIKTTMNYDSANRLLASSVGGRETRFEYDLAGRLASQAVGSDVTRYDYGMFGKVSAVIKPDQSRVGFDYWPNGQISAKGELPAIKGINGKQNGLTSMDMDKQDSVEEEQGTVANILAGFRQAKENMENKADNALSVSTAGDKFKVTEDMLWDGLALIQRGDESFAVEPHVSGGVPIVNSQSEVVVSDFLGTTLGTVKGEEFVPVTMTAFGEATGQAVSQSKTFYTGKPYDADLQGYNFLYRNYQPAMGRWTAVDPSGFPDGVNNMVYAPVPTGGVDPLGLQVVPILEGGKSYGSGSVSLITLPFEAVGATLTGLVNFLNSATAPNVYVPNPWNVLLGGAFSDAYTSAAKNKPASAYVLKNGARPDGYERTGESDWRIRTNSSSSSPWVNGTSLYDYSFSFDALTLSVVVNVTLYWERDVNWAAKPE